MYLSKIFCAFLVLKTFFISFLSLFGITFGLPGSSIEFLHPGLHKSMVIFSSKADGIFFDKIFPTFIFNVFLNKSFSRFTSLFASFFANCLHFFVFVFSLDLDLDFNVFEFDIIVFKEILIGRFIDLSEPL